MKRQIEDAIENYRNGNISAFKNWLKRASKRDLIDAIVAYPDILQAIQRYL
jgi:hypothetical protein